jgi:UDP-2,3-diacylglucosamine pyrophosphatase LpxH
MRTPNSKKRKLDLLVLSDVHLGTYGCHAKELLHYLKSINPKTIVLNGDIIDVWQFSKRYWPKSHMKVVKHLMHWISKGKKTYYITGNHDEMMRKFAGFKLGSFRIVNKLEIDLEEGKRAWFFHGDVFDITMQHSKWLMRLGAIGYDSLILLNRMVNFISEKIFRKGKISLSKKIKNSVKSAVNFISNFEEVCADVAIQNGYQYVVCGHIHQPEMRMMNTPKGSVTYLNSGDWIENLSALEYHDGKWSIYRFADQGVLSMILDEAEEQEEPGYPDLFKSLVSEFNTMKSIV